MSKSPGLLKTARRLLRARKFFNVITLLENHLENHEDEFQHSVDFYYYLGTACLYVDDRAGAKVYFDAARKLTVTDTRVFLAQAALFLRLGETDTAILYYLDVLDADSKNRMALNALEVIQRKSKTPELLAEFIASDGVRKFYPPLGIHPAFKFLGVLLCVVAVGCAGFFTARHFSIHLFPPRADLSAFELSVDQRNNAVQGDLSAEAYEYILTARQVIEIYDAAKNLYLQHRDNAAQIEINRILRSNASAAIKQNARMLMQYLTEPTFDSFTDNIPYADVVKDPRLYADCWVVWRGRISNVQSGHNSFTCDLVVGYEDLRQVEGVVPLVFDEAMSVDGSLPLEVLGQVSIREDGQLVLRGKSVYQPRDGIFK